MMLSKKGQELSMTYVVVAALALVVLIVVILFFTGALQNLFQRQESVIGGESELAVFRSQCKTYCTLRQDQSYCAQEFKLGDKAYKCHSVGQGSGTSLDVPCERSVSGSTVPQQISCGQIIPT